MMHILQLCHKPPYPPVDGGSIAMNQLTHGLMAEGVRLKVFALEPTGFHHTQTKIPKEYLDQTHFESQPIDTCVKLWPALLNLFGKGSYNVSRFFDRKVAKRLASLLRQENFDIIQLEGLYLAPYIPVIRSITGSPLVFRAHNIEHDIWKRLADETRQPLKRSYLNFLARRLRSFEISTAQCVDAIVAISPVDQHFFTQTGFNRPIISIPVGTEIPKPDSDPGYRKPTIEPGSVFHLGSMDWRPNMEGLRWFLKEVWPIVCQKTPEATLHLAGRKMPREIYKHASARVVVDGEVPDALEYMLSKQIMVVPLRSGGGMRVKIIEGMAAGKTIVSTRTGAEGIQCTHQKNILLANTAQEMAHEIIGCLKDPKLIESIGRSAQKFAMENHTLKPLMKQLLDFYVSLTAPSYGSNQGDNATLT